VFYFEEADFGALMQLREKMKPAAEKQGVKLTPLAFIFKALAATLKDHPTFNAALDEEKQELVMHDRVNLAFGVDTEEGLVAPVLKDAGGKSVLQIAKEIREIAERARTRRAGVEDFKGSTFTVTNLGSIGGAFVSAVINPPEAAILGIYRTKEKPVAQNGQVVIRPVTMLGLTFDHRVSDGAAAARMMNELVEKLENPAWMGSL
jgi:pyruvate dehydrogenase E2 component (dihydrolipoamide acetyltransferase)